MIYCTHSDKNYLAKGLALCESIIKHDKLATIFYMATDDETYEKLLHNIPVDWVRKNLIIPFQAKEIKEIETLKQLKDAGHKSNYGDAYSQFCWALTPCMTSFLLENTKRDILYCDADICFYDNPAKIAEACKQKSVGIHSHGFSSYNSETNDVGEFNVGCLYFKNNQQGRNVATWWKNCLLNPQNEHAAKYGTCGDQKYLDLFIPLFGAENICVFDREANIQHAAPWNVKTNDLLFYHFSHFKTDFNGNWSSSNHGEWQPEKDNLFITNLYQNYNQKVTEVHNLIINK